MRYHSKRRDVEEGILIEVSAKVRGADYQIHVISKAGDGGVNSRGQYL